MTPFSEVITRNEIPRPAKKTRLAKNLEFYPALPSRNVQTAGALPEGVRRLYIRLLVPDDTADLIEESPRRDLKYLLELLDDMTRQDARALLAYREDVAGGLMNPRFARLRPNASIDKAITYLRQQLSRVETIYYAYALDEGQRLLGHYMLVGLTIALSLLGIVTFGTVAGSMLPFILRRCGVDPASASAPFVATWSMSRESLFTSPSPNSS